MSTLESLGDPDEPFTYHCFALANGLCSGHVRVECISGGGRIDRAAKKRKGRQYKRHSKGESASNSKEAHLPDHSGATVFGHFTEEPDGYSSRVFNNRPTKERI